MTITIDNISGKNASVDPGEEHTVLEDKSHSIIFRQLYLLGFLFVCDKCMFELT